LESKDEINWVFQLYPDHFSIYPGIIKTCYFQHQNRLRDQNWQISCINFHHLFWC